MPPDPRDACPPGDTLASAPLKVPVRVSAVRGPATERLRLAELGIRPGARVTVVSRAAGGGRVIGVGASRIAVDRGTAARLLVETP